MKKKICLLYGGKSAEHEVSLQTAKAVIQALDHEKYDIYPIFITTEGDWIKGPLLTGPVETVKQLEFRDGKKMAPNALSTTVSGEKGGYDVIFPLLHGPNGEDGTVQGMLELLNLPYVGNGVLASSAGMDKVIMKNLFAQAGLDQVKYVSFIRSEWENAPETCFQQVEEKTGYPCFVKPANLGSSVGISKCKNRTELEAAFKEAFQYDRKIIVEEGVTAREIELGVIGNDDPQCSVAGEIVAKKDFYDYKAKYEDGETALIIPADIPEKVYKKCTEAAITAFKALDCSGLVRADFFVTEDERVIINEINTMPGFTPFSMFPLLWKEAGLDYPQLIEKLIELALERHAEKQRIKYTL
ncbi:D-alanine--D-alanine ligase [Weizmannia coagulans]|jgi:D-alanine-D-alanine ligase|uniref:D-alanine--D-alanine ligase n=2 Tax=Heyndrickxia TaxID=2837504 RepID=A0AAN0WAA0_HEYCO|nr:MULTISPECIES: D-alanine--D-alanine ligase [Heyndrickxia]NWN93110.1 D-alanine--D-alanine ligase [Bacillus sp. (in: firmicutes)]AJO21056.1 D-alanine--D-alanine ligase [Heyndrickxia coagulans]AKN53304.1 D-alanine--D-alanine ligase [Heyndrickxia coagulans]APB37594.1 D-alanine--D-alanine ligase A [Heyndrickxia coagulans]ATW81732.1 D-alanine--D-alanine ligase [Heyndrickxia coagulans]